MTDQTKKQLIEALDEYSGKKQEKEKKNSSKDLDKVVIFLVFVLLAMLLGNMAYLAVRIGDLQEEVAASRNQIESLQEQVRRNSLDRIRRQYP